MYNNTRGMKTVKKEFGGFFVAMLLVLSQFLSLFAVGIKTANAADLPDIGGRMTVSSDTKYNGSRMTLWVAQDGVTPLFCVDSSNHDHQTAGGGGNVATLDTLQTIDNHTYSATDRLMIDYIVYYATIGVSEGKTYYGVSGKDLQAAAQFAIWGVRKGNMIDDGGFRLPFYEIGSTAAASQAAKSFFNDAQAYAQNPASDPNVIQGGAVAFIPDGNKQVMSFFGVRPGSVKLIKTSANTSITDGNNSCYSLAGAVYEVYSDSAATTKVATITTGSDGMGVADSIKAGTYYVKEVKAPKGYALDTTVYTVSVKPGKTTELDVKDTPQNDPNLIKVIKLDAETGKASPLGAGTLAGAEFTVSYYNGFYTKDNLPAAPTRSWVIKTNDEGKTTLLGAAVDPDTYFVSGDEFYKDSFGKATLPLGTVVVQETKAPQGYLLPQNNEPNIQQITSNGTLEAVKNNLTAEQPEQIMRGNVKWVKAIESTQTRVSKALFKVTSKTTGETHYVVTDVNGTFDSSAVAHSANTNANDAAVSADGTVDESKLNPDAGLWFSGSVKEQTTVNDAKGALPYDTYEVTEIITSATEGTKPVTFTVTVSRDGNTVDMGTIDDQPVEKPRIETEFTDTSGSHEIEPKTEVKLHDTVSYTNLTPGTEYKVTMTIHVKGTDGKDEGELKDKDGNPVSVTVTFTPDSANGSVEVPYTIDATKLEGKDIVAFESLTKDGKEIAAHADIKDNHQTVHVKSTPKSSIPKTGQDLFGGLLISGGLIGLLGAAAFVFFKQRAVNPFNMRPTGRL